MTDTPTAPRAVLSTEVVIPCAELGPMVRFFTERLGFELVMIMPADDPAVAVVAGGGGRVRLVRDGDGDPGHLRLRTNCGVGGGETLIAPNGTRIDLVEADPPLVLPPLAPELEISRFADSGWGTGRAGMLYRDLLPGRQGGRFIASHIRIPDAGPVPDNVHHHRIRFQLIHCVAGWVRLVYEDQGPPFVLEAGDCVLQPPGIRHRVLEASEGLEVVEIGCPAEHETFLDHHTELPSPTADRGATLRRAGLRAPSRDRRLLAAVAPTRASSLATPASGRRPTGSAAPASCGRGPAVPATESSPSTTASCCSGSSSRERHGWRWTDDPTCI